MLDLVAVSYDVLLLLHVLLFVYWLGADLAVLYSARYAADPRLSVETRVTISEIMAFVDMFPRMSVPLIGAVGVSLAAVGGYIELPLPIFLVSWLLAAMWVGNGLFIYRHRKSPAATQGPRLFDLYLRSLVAALASIAALAGMLGVGPIVSAMVAVKLLIFAGAILLSLVLRRRFLPFRPALNRIVEGVGGDSDTEIMQRTLQRTRPIVLGLWGLTVAAAAVGLWGRTWV